MAKQVEDMVTQEAELEYLRARVAELEKKVEALNAAHPALAGWLVVTPMDTFSGETAGVHFRRGQAFIPDDAPRLREQLVIMQELGYTCQHVDDFRELPEKQADELRRSFIDIVVPVQMR